MINWLSNDSLSVPQKSVNMGHELMAIELAYLIPANKSIKDEETKKVTLVDIFHGVEIPKNSPVVITSFVVLGKLLGLPGGKFTGKIAIVDDKENLITEVELIGDLHVGDLEIRALFSLVKFEKVGRYYLRAYANGIKLEDNNHFYIDVEKAV